MHSSTGSVEPSHLDTPTCTLIWDSFNFAIALTFESAHEILLNDDIGCKMQAGLKDKMKSLMGEEAKGNFNTSSQSRTNYRAGRWSLEEHKRFVEALEKHGKDWKKIQECVGTRTAAQVRSHAQKHFLKQSRQWLIAAFYMEPRPGYFVESQKVEIRTPLPDPSESQPLKGIKRKTASESPKDKTDKSSKRGKFGTEDPVSWPVQERPKTGLSYTEQWPALKPIEILSEPSVVPCPEPASPESSPQHEDNKEGQFIDSDFDLGEAIIKPLELSDDERERDLWRGTTADGRYERGFSEDEAELNIFH